MPGRVAYHDLGPLALDETGVGEWRNLWLRGGFPRSYLSEDHASSALWREDFIRSHLERDIPALGISVPAETLRRFWVMVSHYHGQTLNFTELGRSFGISDHTVRRYPRDPERHVHDPLAAAVAREHRQATGEGAEAVRT